MRMRPRRPVCSPARIMQALLRASAAATTSSSTAKATRRPVSAAASPASAPAVSGAGSGAPAKLALSVPTCCRSQAGASGWAGTACELSAWTADEHTAGRGVPSGEPLQCAGAATACVCSAAEHPAGLQLWLGEPVRHACAGSAGSGCARLRGGRPGSAKGSGLFCCAAGPCRSGLGRAGCALQAAL